MFIRALAALLGSVVLVTTVQAATVEEFKADNWSGLAFTSDETGDFTHCSVYTTYQDGSSLYLSYEAGDSWYFSVANASWKLDEGSTYPIKLKVDGRGQLEGTGNVLGPTQIGLPVEAGHPFVGQLKRGNRLVFTLQDQDYTFKLSNSTKAMNAVRDCALRHVKLGTRTPVAAATETASNQQSEQTANTAPDETATATRETATADNSASDEGTTGDIGADTTTVDNSTADNATSSSATDTPSQAAGEQQKFGSWVVTATNDGNGNFVNCTAYDVQGDDQLILSYFPDKAWTFGLYRAAWKLDTNQTYYLWYNVDAPADGKDVIKRPVEAAEPTRIFFEVSDVEDIIDRIENGKMLNLKVRAIAGSEETFSYSIEQAHEAFEAARKCVDNHAVQTSTEQPATDDRSAASDSSTEAQDTNASDEANSGSGTDQSSTTTETTENSNAPAPLPSLGSKKLEDLTVSGWTAAAFGQEDGSFTHCAIKAEYQNGATLGFALTAAGEVLLVVKDGEWSLTEGNWVPLSFTLKSDTPYSDDTGQAQAVDATTVIENIGSKEDLGSTVGGATEVTVSAEGKNLSFDTSDIGPAYAAIDKCVSDHAGQPSSTPADNKADSNGAASDQQSTANSGSAEQTNQQVATTGDQATSAEADPEALHTEAAGFTTALLIRSGYANHLILNGDDIPAVLKDHRAVWKIGDLIGLTDMVAGTTAEIQSQVFSSDTQGCAGEITTSVESQSGNYEHLQTVCKKPDSSLISVHYLVIPRETGGSYMLSLIDTGDGAQAAEIAGKVYSTAVPM